MSKSDLEVDLNKGILDLSKLIIEMMALLAEYMQKTDRLLDRMDKHDILFEKQFARMDVAYQVLVAHSERFENLERESKEIQEETRKIKEATLKQETRNEALLNEILSISKRVQAIEGKR